MKNITVSVPDDIYTKARVRAAELNSSVSRLVRDYLSQLTSDDSEYERRKRLQAEIQATIKSFRAADRLDRDDIHDRRALR